jgi:beta-lactamase superfamily II metal-dependent hydrolase
MIKIRMYQAEPGDAFLLSFDNESTNMIVDMGLQKTYSDYIKPDLIDLNQRGHSIDLLVVTHVDNDHIEGVVKFIEENGENSEVIKVKEVWHNSYRHLQFSKKDRVLEQEEISTLKQICSQNCSLEEQSGLRDIGIKEGITLAGLLYGYNYCWNKKLGGKAVFKQSEVIDISPDISIRIISPDTKKLDVLATRWKSKLESEKYDFTLNNDELFDDAFEQYMRMPEFHSEIQDIARNEKQYSFDELVSLKGRDKSATNGSSIAFIIEYKGYKLLFLGDAHEDNIYDELCSLNDLGYELDFDIVKVSHHGSNNNISTRLLELISSKRFLISTNGRHSHPDLGAIAKIVDSGQEAEIITNYTHDKLEVFKSTLANSQNKIKFITTNEIIVE